MSTMTKSPIQTMGARKAAVLLVQLGKPPAALALAEAEQVEEHNVREELSALIERPPEDVATLLRGWLVER